MKELISAPISANLFEEIRHQAGLLRDETNQHAHLAVILVGNHPDSLRYIETKTKRGKEAGIEVSLYHLEEGVSQEEITHTLDFLSSDQEVHGIIVQLPLPGKRSHEELAEIFTHIAAAKDVDGLRGEWQQQNYTGLSEEEMDAAGPLFLPPMVAAICLMLSHYQIDPKGKKTVIVGNGVLVGRPLNSYFSKLGYDVQVVTRSTDHILDIAKQADILVGGAGSKDLITYQWVKEGAVVLDCAQDVHRQSVDQLASAVAPAIGGLGPLTVSWLLHNTLRAARQQLTPQNPVK